MSQKVYCATLSIYKERDSLFTYPDPFFADMYSPHFNFHSTAPFDLLVIIQARPETFYIIINVSCAASVARK